MQLCILGDLFPPKDNWTPGPMSSNHCSQWDGMMGLATPYLQDYLFPNPVLN